MKPHTIITLSVNQWMLAMAAILAMGQVSRGRLAMLLGGC